MDRGADGAQVTCWYHRQFVQAAEDRYLSDPFEKKRLSSSIADYFLGRNYVGELAQLCGFPIQLFRQRLSHKSAKAYATMPIGIMGRKSLALID